MTVLQAYTVEVTDNSNERLSKGLPRHFLREAWYVAKGDKREPHREHGPQTRIIDPTTNEVAFEEWVDHGKVHRADGPASILIDQWQGIRKEQWLFRGEFHRVGGPAISVAGISTGIVRTEEWYNHGKRHRTDGPAYICRNDVTGRPTSETWYRGGLAHRDIGPAEIDWDNEGLQRLEERYFYEDKLHRRDGPACIRYYLPDKSNREEYYIHGDFQYETKCVGRKRTILPYDPRTACQP